VTATMVFSTVMVIPYETTTIVNKADAVPRLAVTNRASIFRGLPDSYYSKIEALPGVIAVKRMTWFGGVYDDVTHQFPSMGIDADNPDVIWPEYAIDKDLVKRFKGEKNGALVGVATMQRFRWHIGDEVSLHHPSTLLTLTFKIIGTINQGPDLTLFLFRRDYLEDATHDPGFTSILWVRCAGMDDTSRLAATIDEMFHNSAAETRAETEKEFMEQMVARFGPIARMVQWIGLSAVLAIALAVLNVTSMTVRERPREIAVLKTLGFSSGQSLLETSVEKRNSGTIWGNDRRRCSRNVR
jgi:putative ABC transport system permease protein